MKLYLVMNRVIFIIILIIKKKKLRVNMVFSSLTL